MPYRSTTVGSISQKVCLLGIISPRPESPTTVPYRWRMFVLQRLAVAFVPAAGAVKRADLRHAEAAADLDVIAAREIRLLLLVPQPPRNVHVHAAEAVGRRARHSFERRNVPLMP